MKAAARGGAADRGDLTASDSSRRPCRQARPRGMIELTIDGRRCAVCGTPDHTIYVAAARIALIEAHRDRWGNVGSTVTCIGGVVFPVIERPSTVRRRVERGRP